LGARGVQVPLMSVLGSAVAALDAHQGVAEVAKYGLGFLLNLSGSPANLSGLRAAGVKAIVSHVAASHPGVSMIKDLSCSVLSKL
jgi:hypothetical protein